MVLLVVGSGAMAAGAQEPTGSPRGFQLRDWEAIYGAVLDYLPASESVALGTTILDGRMRALWVSPEFGFHSREWLEEEVAERSWLTGRCEETDPSAWCDEGEAGATLALSAIHRDGEDFRRGEVIVYVTVTRIHATSRGPYAAVHEIRLRLGQLGWFVTGARAVAVT